MDEKKDKKKKEEKKEEVKKEAPQDWNMVLDKWGGYKKGHTRIVEFLEKKGVKPPEAKKISIAYQKKKFM